MRYLLYPRIRKINAENIVAKVSKISPKEINISFSFADIRENRYLFYAPTGTVADENHLENIRNGILRIAKEKNFPDKIPEEAERSEFDYQVAEFLYTNLKLHSSEASNIEIWFCMTCLLLPDVVRWRFFDSDGTSPERYLGSDRGMRRNTFGRLWWRAYLLSNNNGNRNLLQELNEDELVQITERPSLSNNPKIAGHLGNFYLNFIEKEKEMSEYSRREILRDAIKRIRRITSFTSLNLLDETRLLLVFSKAFNETAYHLRNNG